MIELIERMQKIADIGNAMAVLHWDQEVYMPSKGSALRAKQLSTLSGIAHELFIDKETERILQELQNQNLDEIDGRDVTILQEQYQKRSKYPTKFVQQLSLQISTTYQAWVKSRKENDFKIFEPELKKLVELKQKECELIGYDHHPYDALMDEFEPKANTLQIEQVFNNLRQPLLELMEKVKQQPQVNNAFMFLHYDKQKQWDFSVEVLKKMGYDMEAGRQDYAPHPFTISFNLNDVRVTTRVNEYDLNVLLWSTIHEGGHALYEQNLRTERYGLPSGSACSLGIHESQSRLYENNVGRSLTFWKAFYPRLQRLFPDQLKQVGVEEFYKAMNKVEPGLIRTEADELTYHLHILIRFEIEKELIAGNLAVQDLPEIWNQKYADYLGVKVTDDKDGVLQDIHWSHGSFGYFPTYTLGSLYAAQFYATAENEIPDLEGHIEKGDLLPLLKFLNKEIHQKGKSFTSEEICDQVTGKGLDSSFFVNYINNKFSKVYNF